jgi:hypothetical protein
MTTREPTKRVAWNTLQKKKAKLLWMQPKARKKLEAESRNGSKDKTGAQGEYPLDVLKALFG